MSVPRPHPIVLLLLAAQLLTDAPFIQIMLYEQHT
jgi:hypothetical protein